MNRERLVVVLLCLAAILVVAIVGMSLATDRSREIAVAKLRTKVSAMEGRFPAGVQAIVRPKRGNAPEPPATEPTKPSLAEEERLAAFQRLLEKRQTLGEDPSWKDVFDVCGKRPNEWTDADWVRIAAFLAANRDLMLELRRLAESGEPLYRLDYSKGFSMELPHLARLRDFVRMLVADAAIRASAGDYSEAVDDLIVGTKLAHTLDREPILISQLVRAYLNNAVSNAIEGGFRGEDLSPDQCARLIQCISEITYRQAFADSITTDEIFGLNTFESIRSGEARNVFYSAQSLRPFLVRVYESPLARPWLNIDEETYTDIMGRLGDAACLPYADAKPIIDQIDSEIANLPSTRLLSRMMTSGMGRAIYSASRYETQVNLTCIGLAVEQYHAQNGAYPASLEVVAPILGRAVPTDPLTGQPYVYQSSGGGYSLYSAFTGPLPSDGSNAPQSIHGADANGYISWRGPRKAMEIEKSRKLASSR